MATTMEALLGAVYLDGGVDAMKGVLETLGMIHPFLQVVTLLSLIDHQEQSMLAPPLICFLGCIVVSVKSSCIDLSGPSYE